MSGDLWARASSALGWSFFNTIASRLGTLAIGIVLARLLGPEQFGVFAVAMVALLAVLSFNELGVSLAIVRWPGEPREIVPSVMTISIAMSTLLYGVSYVAAPAFCAAMGAPEATDVVRTLGLSVIISGCVATPAALLQRAFLQGRRTIADQVNNWLGAGVSIALALAGWGAMSLAVGRIAGALASGVLFFVFCPEPVRIGFDREVAGRLLRFGLPLAGSSIVVFAVTYVDQLIVGWMLGPAAVGLYVLAFNLSNWPVGVFSQPVRQVAPAAFARLQDDPPAMRSAFLAAFGLLAAITLPMCLLMSGAARPIIGFVYGEPWLGAAGALAWLGVFAALRVLYELIYDFFVVLASSRVVFTVQVVWLVALLPALFVGTSQWGVAGAAAAHVAVASLVVLPLYLRELRRAGLGVGAMASRVVVPLAAALAVGGTALAVQSVMTDRFLILVVASVVALGVVGVLMLRMRPVLAGLRGTG
ncbi:lipopolysaccharide biosynthesis protein [Streptosporangium carneum]|uniref:Lipopolysaccharide biosynthesis protein n=1 Tax=Streptosporangium carneum TaxID=47481 RepID=A0A9W6I936_9ACTN|nr:lipopolysaccharide biosynthesis protein [Streptosporangium carneum]GLK14356.1 lipopolysaccharide biosynthesis protein [Streptosporangium carneum]